MTGSHATAGASLDATQQGSPPKQSSPPSVCQPAPQLFPNAHLQADRLRAIDADVHFRATLLKLTALFIRTVRNRLTALDDECIHACELHETLKALIEQLPYSPAACTVNLSRRSSQRHASFNRHRPTVSA
jgi:hypothetical protein